MSDEYLGESRRLVSVYRCPRKDEMYLYVDKRDGLSRLPEELRRLTGTPEHSMDLLLTPERRLARADAAEVLRCISVQGFYLQMPPLPEEERQAVILANDKLPARH